MAWELRRTERQTEQQQQWQKPLERPHWYAKVINHGFGRGMSGKKV